MNSKRSREEGSYSAEDTSENKFNIIYRKKAKLNPIIEQKDKIETKKEIVIRSEKNRRLVFITESHKNQSVWKPISSIQDSQIPPNEDIFFRVHREDFEFL